MLKKSVQNNILDEYMAKHPPVAPEDIDKGYPLLGFDLWTDANMLPGEMCRVEAVDGETFKDGGSAAVYAALTIALDTHVKGMRCTDFDMSAPHFSLVLHFPKYNTNVDYNVSEDGDSYIRTYAVWADDLFLEVLDKFVQPTVNEKAEK